VSAQPPAERAPFRPALVVGLITAGLISFAAFIILIGWSAPERQAAARSAASPGASAVGFQGIVELTGKLLPVGNVASESDLGTPDLLVIPLWASDDPERVQQLLRRRSSRATVLILPKWAVRRARERSDWVRAIGPLSGPSAEPMLGRDFEVELMDAAETDGGLDTFGPLKGMDLPLPTSPQVVHSESIELLAGVPGAGALVAQLGSEPHYVIADPDLLNNQGLRRPEAARAAVELLSRLRANAEGTIRFATAGVRGVETPQERNLLRSMFEPPFLAMTIALLVAAALAAAHGLARFGPALRPARAIPFGKAALVENSAGLVRHAGREVRLGTGYADLIRDEAARAGAAPSHLQGPALEAYLDRFTKPGDPPFRPLAQAVRAAGDPGALLAAARALFKWKKDMIR